MNIGHFGLLGLVGILVFLAGGNLLWNDRRLVAVWVRELNRVLRGQVAGSQAAALRQLPGSARLRSGALALTGAVVLILVGGFLFLFDLIR
jgi:hypothetical protein